MNPRRMVVDDIDSESHTTLIDEGYDIEQIGMMSEEVILVDEEDNVIGSMSKVDAHRGQGVLHRAFSLLIFDEDDRLLLQKRASHKITFPNVWANTVCSHPLHVPDELNDEPIGAGSKVAAIRKMEQELGIPTDTFSVNDIHLVGRMMYKSRYDDIWVEHELDHILFARAPSDMIIDPNPNEVSEVRWVTCDELLTGLMREHSGSPGALDIVAPWFALIADLYLCGVKDLWNKIDNLPLLAEHYEEDTMYESTMGISQFGLQPFNVSSPEEDTDDVLMALKTHKDAVESRVINALSKTENKRLESAMKHLIEGGGKRLRAILPWLVADAVGDANDGLYDLGAAIEIIHNFTLVHDDIMDNDSVRRGRPAVHIEYDHPTAINAGDAMLAVAFEVLAESTEFDDHHFRDLVQIIGSMVRRVSEGQQQDMSFEERDDVNESEYLHMISGKTAAMFTTCAKTGALLSGASQETIDIMAEWGESIGLCFQLIDDYIDATGDSETLGKPAGSDIIEGKQTLIAIHARHQDPKLLPNFHEVFGSGIEETDRDVLDTVLSELEEVGSLDFAYSRALGYHSIAHGCLDELDHSPGVAILRKLTNFQLSRIS